MTMPSPETLARRCFEAFRVADRTAIEALLHADFTFTSPRDDHISRDAYFERCWPAAGTFAALRVETVVSDESGGCFVLYRGEAATGGRFRNVERMHVKDGLILAVEVFFGREP